jgi:hypothetical protein
MNVLVTVTEVNSRFAVDVKALETMTELLHGDAQRVMLQKAGVEGEATDKTERGLAK